MAADVPPVPSASARVLPRPGPIPAGWPWIVAAALLGAWLACYPASADPFRRVPGAGSQADLAHHAVLTLAREGWPTTMHTRVVAFPTIQDLHADTGAPFASLGLAGAVRVLGAAGGMTLGLVSLVALAAAGVGGLAASWWRSSVAGVTAAWVVATSGPVAVALSVGAADGLLALAVAPLGMACAAIALRVDRGRWGAAAGACLAVALGAGVVHGVWVGAGLGVLAFAAAFEGLAVGGWTRAAASATSGRVARAVAWCTLALVVLSWGPWLALHASVGAPPGAVGFPSVAPPPPGDPYRWFAAALGTAGTAADGVLAGMSVRPALVALAAWALRSAPVRRVLVPLAWVGVGWTLALGPATDASVVHADARGYTLLSVLGGAVLAGGGAALLCDTLTARLAGRPAAARRLAGAVPLVLLAAVWADGRPWAGGVPWRSGVPGAAARAMAAASGPAIVLPLRPIGEVQGRAPWPTDLLREQSFHGRPTSMGPPEPGRAGAWPSYDDAWNNGWMSMMAACEEGARVVPVDAGVLRTRERMARAGLRTVLVDPERVGGSADGETWRACITGILGEPVGTQGPLQVYRVPEPSLEDSEPAGPAAPASSSSGQRPASRSASTSSG